MKKAKKGKSPHIRYMLAIAILMFFTLILSSVLAFSIGKLSIIFNLILIAVISLLSGFISVKIIEKITHKEKREILAGSLIPLPAIICIMFYIMILNNLKLVETIGPVLASAVFFICFNIPFLIVLYEHEKHKHHLIGLVIAPLILSLVYITAYLLTMSIASENIKPQVIDSLTSNYDTAPVKSYVENCMKSVGEEAVAGGIDIKPYLDAKLESCISSFEAFGSLNIEEEQFTSSVVYGDKTIIIKLYYPLSFRKGSLNYRISDFQTTIER
jgi:hypothetical protein